MLNVKVSDTVSDLVGVSAARNCLPQYTWYVQRSGDMKPRTGRLRPILAQSLSAFVEHVEPCEQSHCIPVSL